MLSKNSIAIVSILETAPTFHKSCFNVLLRGALPGYPAVCTLPATATVLTFSHLLHDRNDGCKTSFVSCNRCTSVLLFMVIVSRDHGEQKASSRGDFA